MDYSLKNTSHHYSQTSPRYRSLYAQNTCIAQLNDGGVNQDREEPVLPTEMPMHYPNSSMTQHNSPKRPSADGARDGGRRLHWRPSVTLAETIKWVCLMSAAESESCSGMVESSRVEGRFIHKMKSSRTKLNYCWNGIMGAVYSAPAHRWRAIPLKAFQWINASPHLPIALYFPASWFVIYPGSYKWQRPICFLLNADKRWLLAATVPFLDPKIVLVKLFWNLPSCRIIVNVKILEKYRRLVENNTLKLIHRTWDYKLSDENCD